MPVECITLHPRLKRRLWNRFIMTGKRFILNSSLFRLAAKRTLLKKTRKRWFSDFVPQRKSVRQKAAHRQVLPEEDFDTEEMEIEDLCLEGIHGPGCSHWIEGERPRRAPEMLPKRYRARFAGHSHQKRRVTHGLAK